MNMISAFDFAVLDWIQANMRCQPLDAFFTIATSLAYHGTLWIAIAVLFIIIKKYRKCGISMAVSMGLGFLISNAALKNIIARPRPFWRNESVELLVRAPKDFSFPSGHTTVCFAAAVVILHYDKRIGIPAVILASLIGFSRLYLYVHFPTDVIVGMLVGVVCAMIAVRIIDAAERKHYFSKC